MGTERPNRNFWRTYTPRNVRNEIQLRLAAIRSRYAAGPSQRREPSYDGRHATSVGQFYDAYHEQFMRVYGDVIQAFRTRNVIDLLNYQIKSIGLRPGQRLLDAGCGVAAPAIYFAKHAQVQIDAITISASQYKAAREKVKATGLADSVMVVHGDYHRLTEWFPRQAYDVVYFLESFGHSRSKQRLLEQCWEMLKPGGLVYIKDLFRRIPLRPEHAALIDREIRKIDEKYHYEITDLNAVLTAARGKGFILASLQSIDLDLEQFEDLAISNEFQELTGLALIENWGRYVFPVDFFELKCVKPEFNLEERLDRHFLQNRYHLRAAGAKG
jgi:ubiquinone/menaquinone biosynthesis C-methylase UbiE